MIFLEPYEVLSKVYRGGAHLKLALSALPAGEKGRTVRLSYAVLENDAYLNLCVASIAKKKPQESVRLILKIALAAMLFADMVPPLPSTRPYCLRGISEKAGRRALSMPPFAPSKKGTSLCPKGTRDLQF